MHGMDGPIGSPRISPSAIRPGVGMPRVSPANNMPPRQPTPLVSPQSDQSPISQNPLTPSGPSQGPLTPQGGYGQNPLTPHSAGMGPNGQVSPMTPQPMHNPRTPQSVGSYQTQPPSAGPGPVMASPKQESSMISPSPVPNNGYDDLKSPGMKSPTTANNLRKIRRPSKPGGNMPESPKTEPVIEPKVEPLAEPVKQEPLSVPPVREPTPEPEPVKEEPKVEEPKFEARWEELPEKVINRVLSFVVANEGSVPSLIRASKVNKAWNEATKDKDGRKTLWTHLDLSSGRLKEKYRSDKKLEAFLKRYKCEDIKEIKLTGWKNSVGTSTLKMLASVCPNLVSLGLASCFKLSNEDLKYVGENFKFLERLDLSNVSVSVTVKAILTSQ